MTHEYIFDTWGDDKTKCEAIAIYEYHPGESGDYLTPSELESAEIVDVIYRIHRHHDEGFYIFDVPSNDYHFDSLDICSLEESCLEDYKRNYIC